MQPSQIEEWALRIIAGLRQHRPIEDSRVELKGNWPDPEKAARRIAGHANAALGEDILWLIGVAENGTLSGLDTEELANWWPQVLASMRPPFPEAQPVTVFYDDEVAVALLIDTSRAPYLVKNPAFGTHGGGPVEFEVPWREMTATRSARHEDLIRLLIPQTKLPATEVLVANLDGRGKQDPTGSPTPPRLGESVTWTLTTAFYFVPRQRELVVLPGHKCRIHVEEQSLGEADFRPLQHGRQANHLILSPLSDIFVDQPLRVEVLGRFTASDAQAPGDEAVARISFPIAGEGTEIRATCRLKRTGDWHFSLVEATATGQ